MDRDESDRLLRHLLRQAHVPEYQVRLRRQRGGIAFWDNRAAQHYAVGDHGSGRRVAERVAIEGDRPFWHRARGPQAVLPPAAHGVRYAGSCSSIAAGRSCAARTRSTSSLRPRSKR